GKDEVMSEGKQNNWPDHFRYVDEIGPEGLTVTCKRYVVVRESDCCYWICSPDYELVAKGSIQAGKLPPYVKRVLKQSSRRFAYPDKKAALHSYKARKTHQISHAQLALERAKAAIGYFGDRRVSSDVTPEVTVIPSQYIQELNWSEY
ncbi:Uncharacterized protein ALO87_01504, partial [Pseudomonas syringae pv. apii]|uniref:hypothetical protein n=1 Tax=Pseudomonas syringae group genomosp. 3 TaxID=251701 RepID=UPI0006E67593